MEDADHHLHFDVQDEAVAAILHQDLGVDDKVTHISSLKKNAGNIAEFSC
jgi:Ser/Thr protein kinase RdoA (MazF antagonist)